MIYQIKNNSCEKLHAQEALTFPMSDRAPFQILTFFDESQWHLARLPRITFFVLSWETCALHSTFFDFHNLVLDWFWPKEMRATKTNTLTTNVSRILRTTQNLFNAWNNIEQVDTCLNDKRQKLTKHFLTNTLAKEKEQHEKYEFVGC